MASAMRSLQGTGVTKYSTGVQVQYSIIRLASVRLVYCEAPVRVKYGMLLPTQPITVRSGAILENVETKAKLVMGQLEVAGAKIVKGGRLVGWVFKIGPDEYFVEAADVVSIDDWP